MRLALSRRVACEGVGTFALVAAGCGAIAIDRATASLGHVGVALSFGLVIFVMVASLGHLSGAHFNPAVTFAFALHRHFPWREVVPYVVGQVAGALAGSLALRLLLGAEVDLGVTRPVGSAAQAFGVEVLLTALLMFVITAVATDTRAVGELAAVAIGGTVALDALWGGPVSGASMNPARSLAPAFISGQLTAQWIYCLAPLLGAALGGGAYQLLRGGASGSAPADPSSA